MLKKIDSELTQQEIYQEVIELIKNHPEYSQYYNDFINSNFVSFFNYIFSNIMTALQNKLEIYFNNHFPTTIYDKDFGYNLLHFIGYNPKCISAAEVEITFFLKNLPTNADPTIQLNPTPSTMLYPIYFSFEGKNKNGETNNWELLQKDENGEFDYLFTGNYKFDETNCTLENGFYKYNNKIKFYSGKTYVEEYITNGINNETIVITTEEEDIQLNSIRVYKILLNNTLIPMKKIENFIEENYNTEEYTNNSLLLPYIVYKKNSKEYCVQFGHKAYTQNRIPKKGDRFLIFYRKKGGSLDNIPAYSIDIDKTILHKINGSEENTELIYMNLKNLSDAIGGVDNEDPLESIFTQVQRQKTFSYSGLRLKQETDYKVLLEDERSDIVLSASYGIKHVQNDGKIYGEEDYVKSDDVFIYVIPKKEFLKSPYEYDIDILLNIDNMIIANYPLKWEKQNILGEETYYFKLPYNFINYSIVNNRIKYDLFLTREKIFKYTNIFSDIKNFNTSIGIELIESIKDNIGYAFNVFNYGNNYYESLESGNGIFIKLKSTNNLIFNNYTIEIIDNDSAPKSWILEGLNISTNNWETIDEQTNINWNLETKKSFNLTSLKNYKEIRFNNLTNENNKPVKIKFIELKNLKDRIQEATLICPESENNINFLKNNTDIWSANNTTCNIHIIFNDFITIDTITIIEPETNYDGLPLEFSLYGCNNYINDNSYELIQIFKLEDDDLNKTEIVKKIKYPVTFKRFLLKVTNTKNNENVKILQLKLFNNFSIIPNLKFYKQNNFEVFSNSENISTNSNFEIIQYEGEMYLKLIPIWEYDQTEEKYIAKYKLNPEEKFFITYKKKKNKRVIFNDVLNFEEKNGKYFSYIQNDNIFTDKKNFTQYIKLTHNLKSLTYDDINDEFVQQKNYIVYFDQEKKKMKIEITKDYIKEDIKRNNNILYSHYLIEYENKYKNVLNDEEQLLEYLQNYSLMNIENRIKQPIIVPFSLKITLYMYENPYIEQIENEVVSTLRKKYSFGALQFGESIPVEQIIAIINNISPYISYGKVDYFGLSYKKYQLNVPGFENLNFLFIEQNQVAVLQKDEKYYDYNKKKYITTEGLILETIVIKGKK